MRRVLTGEGRRRWDTRRVRRRAPPPAPAPPLCGRIVWPCAGAGRLAYRHVDDAVAREDRVRNYSFSPTGPPYDSATRCPHSDERQERDHQRDHRMSPASSFIIATDSSASPQHPTRAPRPSGRARGAVRHQSRHAGNPRRWVRVGAAGPGQTRFASDLLAWRSDRAMNVLDRAIQHAFGREGRLPFPIAPARPCGGVVPFAD